MSTITRIVAREVLDSRGTPAVEAEVHSSAGSMGRAIAPSGTSTASTEAFELRDTADARHDGRGVSQAVAQVIEKIGPALKGYELHDQRGIDARMIQLDGSHEKRNLGGNAILAVSLACAQAAAAAERIPLYRHLHTLFRQFDSDAPPPRIPLPMVTMISGGLHVGGKLDFQDFLVKPIGASSYAEGLEWTGRVYRRLGTLLSTAGHEGRLVGDSGGYGPKLRSHDEALDFLLRAIEAAGLRSGRDVLLGLNVASTHFYDGRSYRLPMDTDVRLSSDEMIDLIIELTERYPIKTLIDPLAEDDWSGWQRITTRLGKKLRLAGDDLFSTQSERLQRGAREEVANSIVIKLNQVGTLSEAFETVRIARKMDYSHIVSARSGDSEGTTMVDLAVATGARLIKIGALARGERVTKYNRLLRIAEEIER